MGTGAKLIGLGVLLLVLMGAALGAQWDGQAVSRTLQFLPTKQAWVLTYEVPDQFQFCADAVNGQVHGCVTAKELRAKAAVELRGGK